MDGGRSHGSLLLRGKESEKVQRLQAELIDHVTVWRDYESMVDELKLAPRMKNHYVSNFSNNDATKGYDILWLWSVSTNVGKTRFAKAEMRDGAGQVTRIIQAEPNA